MVLALVVMVWQITNKFINWAGSLEHERTELRTQLYHTHKLSAIGQLAGGVAHEINNPLAIISSEAGLIRDMLDPRLGMKCSPELIKKELDEIDTAVYRAKNITKKILSFVRKTEPRLTPCNLNDLLEDVVSGVKEQEFAVSNITLIRDYDPNIPSLMLDADMMQQVFFNLINNAGDALPEGGIITMKTRLEDNWVKTTIADNGIGIDPEKVQKIFMPFFTTKEVGKGTGLGLAISLSIIEGFGGHINVESKPGSGTAFQICLPLAVQPDFKDNYLTGA
jgi:two-component system, NtrC family, sensor kinase